MTKVSPSILGVDYLNLDEILTNMQRYDVDMVHLDVMDGEFVPNISFGVPVIKSISEHTSLPLDVHLMIDRPHRYIKDFAKYADWLNIHYEAGSDLIETLTEIRKRGCKPAVTIKPNTKAEDVFPLLDYVDMVLVMSVEPGFGGQSFMPSALGKLSALRDEIRRRGLDVELEVDGGINAETAAQCVKAGATVLVAGSYVFNSNDIGECITSLRKL